MVTHSLSMTQSQTIDATLLKLKTLLGPSGDNDARVGLVRMGNEQATLAVLCVAQSRGTYFTIAWCTEEEYDAISDYSHHFADVIDQGQDCEGANVASVCCDHDIDLGVADVLNNDPAMASLLEETFEQIL